MMDRSSDPTREVALIALKGSAYPTETLRQVILYAFDQVCFSMTEEEIDQFLDGLRDTQWRDVNRNLLSSLKELYAVILGEAPRLLHEDSGGNEKLDARIREAISNAEDGVTSY